MPLNRTDLPPSFRNKCIYLSYAKPLFSLIEAVIFYKIFQFYENASDGIKISPCYWLKGHTLPNVWRRAKAVRIKPSFELQQI